MAVVRIRARVVEMCWRSWGDEQSASLFFYRTRKSGLTHQSHDSVVIFLIDVEALDVEWVAKTVTDADVKLFRLGGGFIAVGERATSGEIDPILTFGLLDEVATVRR